MLGEIKVLLVDDDPHIIKILVRYMKKFGFNYDTAQNGLEALEKLQGSYFDIVLTDIVMPNMDGMRLLELIGKKYPKIDVIVITGYDQTYTCTKVIKAGASDFISKPIDFDKLEAKFNRIIREREQLRQLELQSVSDDLTGLYNRRHLNTILKQEFNRCLRYGSNLALLILDLDHFKKVNDTHGHKFGDFVLKTFAHRILEVSRSTDHIFRFGGEEFIVLLSQTDNNGGMVAGEKIRKKCQSELYTKDNISLQVTTSIGVSCLQSCNEVPNDMIAKADKALYIAKREGRNKVVLCE